MATLSLLMPYPLSFPFHPSKFSYLQTFPFVFFLLFFFLSTPATSRVQLHPSLPSVAEPQIPYSDHCNDIVLGAPVDPSPAAAFSVSGGPSLRFDIGFFSGGDTFFDRNRPPNSNTLPKSATFSPISIRRTLTDQKVYKVEARLSLRIPRSFSSYFSGNLSRRRLRQMHYKQPKMRTMVGSRGGPSFSFTGFWSESTGRLCMVGLGSLDSTLGNLRSFDARLTLNYSTDSSIYGSLIKGVLESVSEMGNESYFEPISILGIARNTVNYEYKLLEQGKSECGKNREERSLSLERVRGLCSVFSQSTHVFNLRYENGCGGNSSCILFGSGYMSLFPNLCEKERMQMLLSFGNTSGSSLSSEFPFDPRSTLVAEGAWDAEKNRFCGVACRILNSSETLSNAVIDDCFLRLSLNFPAVLSIRRMSSVVGQIWSVKKESEDGGFFSSRIGFWSLREPLWHFPSLRYEYTESERVKKSCVRRSGERRRKEYPDAQTSDMRFHMTVTRNNGVVYAHATPLFVGNQLYRNLLVLGHGTGQPGVAAIIDNVQTSFTNISYRIRFSSDFDASGLRSGEIYAEGTYDRDTGILCMIGCQPLSLTKRDTAAENDSMDCSIKINMKFSPMQSRTDYRLKGAIESTREMKDPLYFGRLEMLSRSIYASEARASVWRMDLEITMVLISNTFSCVLISLQLFHTKKHQESVQFISIVMLIMLTLGHMIPLLLNFEAIFKTTTNHGQQNNMFFENDGWLEANEIVVRMVMMIAFLLESRLLQLAWIARRTSDSKTIWDAEKKVFYVCLPLYMMGGLIAWLVNLRRSPYARVYVGRPYRRHLLYRPFNLKRSYQRPSLWKDLKSYGGLMLDGFLLPQILFNTFCDSKEKPLAALYYVGTTVVRLLPHAYDLYRGHHSYGKLLDWSYIYANHKMDYYSTSWDIFILCAGLLFAFLIFMQQRFGSRSFLPKRFRENAGYERVSGVANLELQKAADTKEVE